MKMFQSSPNDSPMDGTIHDIARRQLSQWEAIAKTWRIVSDLNRDGREAAVCGSCNQVVWFLSDVSKHAYVYTPQMRLALVTAHIRQTHPEAGSAID